MNHTKDDNNKAENVFSIRLFLVYICKNKKELTYEQNKELVK
jgi:hypothetical protein